MEEFENENEILDAELMDFSDSTDGVSEEINEDLDEEFSEDWSEVSLEEMDLASEESQLEQSKIEEEPEMDEGLLEGTELEAYETAPVEEEEFLEFDEIVSILESLLFATDRPQSLTIFKQAFKGTNARTRDIKKALDELMIEYAGGRRGVSLYEVNGGYQLRTKIDNMTYLKRMVKGKSFKLSGPALEVLSIVAYKQPCIKSQIDEIRGVESGHLLRGLMERGLIHFAGKSELPGKPMQYSTSKKFLEIFGLRNLQELPSLSEIEDLIPEGIGSEEEEAETLGGLADNLAKKVGDTYSEGEEELEKITEKLGEISTSTDFFEQEKKRMQERRDLERAQNLKEAIDLGEDISIRDKNWLSRWEENQKSLDNIEEIQFIDNHVENASDEENPVE